MQDITDSSYYELLADPNHWFEHRMRIYSKDLSSSQVYNSYTPGELWELRTSHSVFKDGVPSVGGAIAGEINVTFKPKGDIAPMAMVRIWTRVTNGSSTSEWIKKGTYYIDTREKADNGDGLELMRIHGYDAMLKFEQDYPSDVAGSTGTGSTGSGTGTGSGGTGTGGSSGDIGDIIIWNSNAASASDYPMTDIDMVNFMAGKVGIPVDARTTAIMTAGYSYSLPLGYTMREMLGYIAASYGGNFIITDENHLLLIALNGIPAETNYLIDEQGYALLFGDTRILV